MADVGVQVVRGIRRALFALRDRMSDIADGEGDLTARLSEAAADETGEVARAVNRFISRVQETVRQMAGAADTLGSSVDTLGAVTTQMAANAATEAARATYTVSGVVTGLRSTVGRFRY